MTRILCILALVLTSSWSQAERIEVTIPTDAVLDIELSGGSYPGFALEMPEEVSMENFLTAQLEIRASRSVDCQDDFFEVEVAHLVNGSPVIPFRKTGYVSEFSMAEGTTSLYMDLSAILRHCLLEEVQDMTLILGAMSEDIASCGELSPLDPSEGAWAAIRFQTRD